MNVKKKERFPFAFLNSPRFYSAILYKINLPSAALFIFATIDGNYDVSVRLDFYVVNRTLRYTLERELLFNQDCLLT